MNPTLRLVTANPLIKETCVAVATEVGTRGLIDTATSLADYLCFRIAWHMVQLEKQEEKEKEK